MLDIALTALINLQFHLIPHYTVSERALNPYIGYPIMFKHQERRKKKKVKKEKKKGRGKEKGVTQQWEKEGEGKKETVKKEDEKNFHLMKGR